MKSDRQTYRRPREPVNKRWFAWKHSDLSAMFVVGLAEVARNLLDWQVGNLKYLWKDCFDKTIVRFPLKTNGNDSTFCHSRMFLSACPPHKVCFGRRGILSLPFGKHPTGISELDVGEPPGGECDVGRTLDELVSSELETIRLTNEEVRHDCGLVSEKALLRNKKSPAAGKNGCTNKSCTQQSIVFWYTLSVQGQNISCHSIIKVSPMARSTLSEFERCECINVNRLWLEAGFSYSNIFEYDSIAAINSAGPEASRRNENWYPGFRWFQFILPTPRDSVMVESLRLVLQRWRGVCSFSQTMRSNWSDEESHLVYGHCSKNEVDPENDYAQIKLKGSEI